MAQHLHHTLFIELVDALMELLEPARVERPSRGEELGGKARDAGEHHLLACVQRVAHADIGGVDQTNDITGERFLDGLSLLTEHRMGVLRGERFACGAVSDDHAALETA